ncbi:MAG: SUMF1/EgtB/PvdO family nonheme iron enzyme [Anaerolineales bacterium]|nr:SUMF1/EgtB/PvdO family nonheme iron enzyme [Anaerolineales bacterium]
MKKSSIQIHSFLFCLTWSCLLLFLSSCAAPSTQPVVNTSTDMALIPAGEFEMKIWDEMENESTLRTVYLDDFYLDKYEVTNRRYAQCVQEGACLPPVNDMKYSKNKYSDHPVIFITREMASSYCAWREARLPTKAEWEKAAQDELEEVDYYWGEESPVCQTGARLARGIETETNFDPETKPVGSTEPNIFGLYEMTGGMWEWIEDSKETKIYKNPPDVVSFLRMSRWSGYGPVYQRFLCSFRCAYSPDGE